MSNFRITIDTLMDKEEQSRIGINPDDVEHKRDSNQILCRILEGYSALQAKNKLLREALERYGEHEPCCMKGDACNCGYSESLKGE